MAILTKRQDKAIAINALGRKVLMFNMAGMEEKTYEDMVYTDYARDAGSKAVVIKKSRRYGDMRLRCTLERITSNREVDQWRGSGDYFYLGLECSCLKEADYWSDYTEFAEYANAPVIEEGDKCSILEYNPETGETAVHTVIARDVCPDYSTACRFEEESPEETREAIHKIKVQRGIAWK